MQAVLALLGSCPCPRRRLRAEPASHPTPLAWYVSPRATSRLFSFKQPLRLWGEQRGRPPAALCLLPKVLETHSLLPSGDCVRRRGPFLAYPPPGHPRAPPQPLLGSPPWSLSGHVPLVHPESRGPGGE